MCSLQSAFRRIQVKRTSTIRPQLRQVLMTILVGETQRMMLLMNLVFSDRVNPTESLTSEELALFDCETSEELLANLDGTLMFFSPDDNKRLSDGLHLIGQSLFYSGHEGLTGRQMVEKTEAEDLSKKARRNGSFMLVSAAVQRVVRSYNHVVTEYEQPDREMRASLQEALSLIPEDSPVRASLSRYL